METVGVTVEQLELLKDKKEILQAIEWKPDKLANGRRLFFPYLPIGFVKGRLIEVLGSENMEFILEKDHEEMALGRLGIRVNSEMQYFSAIGVEKEGKNITDKEKKNKLKYKGNVADTIKSCAEWLGLMVPPEITQKTLIEKDKILYNDNNQRVGHLYNEKDKINAYLNGISYPRFLLSKVYSIHKTTFDSNERLMEALKTVLEGIENEK